jgi:hypothetical protein
MINSQSIPKELHALIPLVEQWSFSDDDERLRRMITASPDERAEFLAVMREYQKPLTAWLKSVDVTRSDDAAAIAWLDIAAAELEAIESRQSRSTLRQVVTAFLVIGVCIIVGLLIAFVYSRLRR